MIAPSDCVTDLGLHLPRGQHCHPPSGPRPGGQEPNQDTPLCQLHRTSDPLQGHDLRPLCNQLSQLYEGVLD